MSAGARHHEKVPFRVIVMPCCMHTVCWVNPRLPSHCPECGTSVFARIREGIRLHDPEATLSYKELLV